MLYKLTAYLLAADIVDKPRIFCHILILKLWGRVDCCSDSNIKFIFSAYTWFRLKMHMSIKLWVATAKGV